MLWLFFLQENLLKGHCHAWFELLFGVPFSLLEEKVPNKWDAESFPTVTEDKELFKFVTINCC